MKKSHATLLAGLLLLGAGSIAFYHQEIGNALSKLLIQQNQQQGTRKNEEEKKEEGSSTKRLEENEALVNLTDEQIKQHGLKTQTASPRTLGIALATRGKIILDPDRVAHVFPKIPGIAADLKKAIGNTVKEGELLAILESQEMANLKAAYLAAQSKERLADSIYKREESLYQKRVSSEQDYLNARNRLEEESINLQLAKQRLQAFGLSEREMEAIGNGNELRLIPIYATIDGTIIKKHLTKGEYVDDESMIYEIADLSNLFVEMAIYLKDLQKIKKGQVVEVTNLENGAKADAKLIYISPIIEEETIAAKIYAQLDNSRGDWRPGSLVGVKIAIDQVDVPVAICSKAIQKINGIDCAFIQTEKGFEKREVKLGRDDLDNIEILSGIKAGERYVSENPFLIKAEMNKDSAKDED